MLVSFQEGQEDSESVFSFLCGDIRIRLHYLHESLRDEGGKEMEGLYRMARDLYCVVRGSHSACRRMLSASLRVQRIKYIVLVSVFVSSSPATVCCEDRTQAKQSRWASEKETLNWGIATCDAVIKLRPNDANAYVVRGRTYYTKGDHDKAIADYTKAIQLDPKHAKAYFGLSLACVEKGDRDKKEVKK